MSGALKAIGLLLAVFALSTLLALGIVTVIDFFNADEIQACHEVGGNVMRGYLCNLPDGTVVDPIRWSER